MQGENDIRPRLRSRMERESPTPPPRTTIWVVTDGRAGNENPALGLAERVAPRMGRIPARIEVIRLTLRRPAAILPAPAWTMLGATATGWPFIGLLEGGDLGRRAQHPAERPALIIGAGRRAAPIVAALGKIGKGAIRTVQLLDPKLATDRFDLTIAPQHDRLFGPGRLATIGSLHRIDPSTPPGPDPRLPTNGRPRVAFLIGGKSKSASFGAIETSALIDTMSALARDGGAIAATASRRTPEVNASLIRDTTRSIGGFFWDGAGDNPYLQILFWSDILIVTADSVNMASEACALGKPVYIAPAERLSQKFRQFHQALFEGGHARPLPRDTSAVEPWRQTPLNDMSTATQAVLELFRRGASLKRRA